jgi:hypothetical protein
MTINGVALTPKAIFKKKFVWGYHKTSGNFYGVVITAYEVITTPFFSHARKPTEFFFHQKSIFIRLKVLNQPENDKSSQLYNNGKTKYDVVSQNVILFIILNRVLLEHCFVTV